MRKPIRHGDIALVPRDKMPEGLTEANTKVMMTGSHGHDHSIDNGKIYFKEVGPYIFGYLVSKNTSLFHPEHTPNGEKIPNGIWELRKQQEFTPAGLVPVID